MRRLVFALCLALSPVGAFAEGHAPEASAADPQLEAAKRLGYDETQAKAVQTAKTEQNEVDLSRSVTLTGSELDAYVRASVAQARAQDAAQSVQEVARKIKGALTKPKADAPGK